MQCTLVFARFVSPNIFPVDIAAQVLSASVARGDLVFFAVPKHCLSGVHRIMDDLDATILGIGGEQEASSCDKPSPSEAEMQVVNYKTKIQCQKGFIIPSPVFFIQPRPVSWLRLSGFQKLGPGPPDVC